MFWFYFGLGFTFFLLGLVGILFRRNLIFTLMSLDLLSNGMCLLLLGSSGRDDSKGAIIPMVLQFAVACELILGVIILTVLVRSYRTIRTDFYRVLRG